MLGKILDARADGIRSELEEARSLHEEAKALLASYEKKQAEVQAQADRIVEAARVEAATAAEQAKADIKKLCCAPHGCGGGADCIRRSLSDQRCA